MGGGGIPLGGGGGGGGPGPESIHIWLRLYFSVVCVCSNIACDSGLCIGPEILIVHVKES